MTEASEVAMRVFVTGGSGFVGGRVIEALVAAGHEVAALARSEASAAKVVAKGAEPVRRELLEVTADDLRGADAVIHAAAYVEPYGPREAFWSVNVDGTTRLLEVARAAGVGRFVHVGTEAALFDGGDLVRVDESAPYPARQRFLYSETKAEAERRVLSANAPGFHTVSVRPRLVWGPGDNTLLPVFRKMVEDGGWLWLDGGRHLTSTAHVDNVAHALVLALDHGRGGEAYFVGDEDPDVTLREFLGAYAKAAGIALPDRSVPGALARPLAYVVEGAWRALGLRGQPPLLGFAVAMMSREVTVRTDKARAELGYAPVVRRSEGLRRLAHA